MTALFQPIPCLGVPHAEDVADGHAKHPECDRPGCPQVLPEEAGICIGMPGQCLEPSRQQIKKAQKNCGLLWGRRLSLWSPSRRLAGAPTILQRKQELEPKGLRRGELVRDQFARAAAESAVN